ncbi:MAG: hypothetical protein DU429_08010 [Candidatus Tokpelaia sp.]|nr:MAG: hypothetical protein DU429_08010 [Candidatus Tokpelaia sp.]KAA6206094.1 MAG: hypothetical protein DU430_02255 [Candidatus Tokpelaia sp.]
MFLAQAGRAGLFCRAAFQRGRKLLAACRRQWRKYCRRAIIAAPVFIALTGLPTAQAQEEPGSTPQETLQIIVTARDITIDASFAGTDFYIAGVLENTDPLLRRQNRYDIIVVLEGPQQNIVLYKKERRLGLWLNGSSVRFTNVPQFYALASTRELRDITVPQIYQSLGLGLNYLPLHAKSRLSPEAIKLYKNELIALKQKQGLYGQETGSIAFGSTRLFSARFHLPDNVPVGSYTVKAYLFRDGVYSDEAETGLEITRKNIAYLLYHAAQTQSFRYGLAAVLIALFIGFIGRTIFPK